MTNPYRCLLDPQNDAEEHKAELRDGYAIRWGSSAPERRDQSDLARRINDHRLERARLQAALAAEAAVELDGAA